MSFLRDSNAWIAWLRQNQPKLVARLKQESPANVVLCSVVLGELIYGAERSGAAHRAANRSRVTQVQGQYASIPFDDLAAEEYGRIRAYLDNQGTPIGPNDTMIAAIALANGCTRVTHNTAEFGRVPGLMLEDWQAP
ncbi:MAG TPA: type II toxin-antitoxin system VapC family toxin [Gemmataceae bacterium]|nr:type II toxin-antitoxin system VapC family toxin [Gemmataceae bacterium]